MEIRAATEGELEDLVELQRLVFRPNEAAQARYWSYVRQEPTYRLEQSRIAVDGGRIVAHLRVWERMIQLRGAQLRAGGIGSVLTHPDCRGRGYARALLQDTEGYMQQAGYDLGLLFTIIGTPFYQRLGWTAIPLPTFELEAGTAPGAKTPDVRRLDSASDLEAVQAVYRSHNTNMTGPEVRTSEYWTSGPSCYRGVFPDWGVEWDGKLVAYVNFAVEEECVWVKEACALPDCETAYTQLAGLVIAQAQEAGLDKIAGSLPSGHTLVEHLAAQSGTIPCWGVHEEMMLKLVNWDALSRKLGHDALPAPPKDESACWRALFGQQADSSLALAAWMGRLPKCQGPFYWWSDIF